MSEQMQSSLYQTLDSRFSLQDDLFAAVENSAALEAQKIYHISNLDTQIAQQRETVDDLFTSDVARYLEYTTIDKLIENNKLASEQKYKQDINNNLSAISEQQAKVNSLSSEKISLTQALKKQLETIKSDKSKLEGTDWSKLAKQSKATDTIRRAEDLGEFNLYIRINGLTHKIIEGCHLVGHNFAVSSGDSSALKEQYHFIARKVR